MKRFGWIIGCCLLLAGCTADKGYPTDLAETEIGPYVRLFLQKAKQYGKNYDDIPLSYTFDDLEGDKAGVCDMRSHDPIQVRFDYEYWQTLEGPVADDMKENLVFHELGHGLCRRYHDNKVLSNGDWKTLMCGDELPDGRGPSINYRGMRKEYYIRELFTQTKDVPAWSTYVPDFSTAEEECVFPRITDKETADYKILFEGEKYKHLECTVGETSCSARETSGQAANLVLVLHGWRSDEDFYLESDLSLTGEGPFGMVVGCLSDSVRGVPMNGHYLMLDGKGHLDVGEMNCPYSFIDLYEEMDDPKSAKLGMRRHGDTLFYYLNDRFVYYNDLVGLPQGGGYLAFQLPPRATLTMSSLSLYVPKGGTRRACRPEVVPQEAVCLPELPRVWKK
ncbi:MAG: hypothetical protein J6Z12_00380 [Paludibacteraceae bacterium]|nr:hypothetical protein [Paludibacteraceae bacterium]